MAKMKRGFDSCGAAHPYVIGFKKYTVYCILHYKHKGTHKGNTPDARISFWRTEPKRRWWLLWLK